MLTREGKIALADAGVAGFTLPRIGLFTNDFAPNQLSVYADFTLPVYTGYANVTPTLSPVFISHPEKVKVALSDAVFLGPTAGPGTDVFGWFLFDNTTHTVFACGRFADAPLALQNLLDRLEADIDLIIDGSDVVTVDN